MSSSERDNKSVTKSKKGRPSIYSTPEEALAARHERIKLSNERIKQETLFRKLNFSQEQKQLIKDLTNYLLTIEECMKIRDLIDLKPEKSVKMLISGK